MKKQIPPPSNWQDFEDLCKQIFGEIWGCKYTIKKHGRNGQNQCGVDVYGIPHGENQLYGIQCKGKDTHFGKELTVSEVDNEIKNALGFEPKLKTFVFATTAQKDAKIEKYILNKSLESVQKGDFEILLYDWEDLADIIRRNKNLYDFYVSNQSLENQNSVSLLFDNDSDVQPIQFELKKIITEFKQPLRKEKIPFVAPVWANLMQDQISIFGSDEYNQSWCNFKFLIHNTGNQTIEDWKVYFSFDENTKHIDDGSPKGIGLVLDKEFSKFRTLYKVDKKQILYEPLENKPLVPNDSKGNKISFLPHIDAKEIVVKWELLSRHLNYSGELKILLNPTFEIENKTEEIFDNSEERIEEEISYLIKKVEKQKLPFG